MSIAKGENDRIEDLPKVLIQKRISLSMTQRELAEKLGIKEQMVQRYESTAYESIRTILI
jgi:transcriptional regulator with XRE-family HTH domain